MRKVFVMALAGAALLAGSAAPADAWGGRRHHHFRPHHSGPGFGAHVFIGVPPWPYWYEPPWYRPYPSPPVIVAPPAVIAPIYAFPAPVVIAAPPPPPAAPTVVEYPHGRYELRGDGIRVPYTWVWIPNPPPAPPAQ